MTYKEIIEDIKKGLTGDSEVDALYLESKIGIYKNHASSEKILGFCIDLILEKLSEEEREALKEWVERPGAGIRAALDGVEEAMVNGNYEEAKKILEPLIDEIEEIDDYEDTDSTVYRTFHEPFELIMYENQYKVNKEILGVEDPFDDVYLSYGLLLTELKEFEHAREIFIKGQRWNPVNANLLLGIADTYQMENNLEKFFETTIDAFKVSFKAEQVGRCFVNLGDYFSVSKLYPPARICYNLALIYDELNTDSNSGLKYIELATGNKYDETVAEKIESISEEYGIPKGADADLVALATTCGEEALNEKNFVMARYYFETAYDIGDEEVIGEYLDRIPEE